MRGDRLVDSRPNDQTATHRHHRSCGGGPGVRRRPSWGERGPTSIARSRPSYDGVAVQVPASWPVVHLGGSPGACVTTSTRCTSAPRQSSTCPAHLVGHTGNWSRSLRVTRSRADAIAGSTGRRTEPTRISSAATGSWPVTEGADPVSAAAIEPASPSRPRHCPPCHRARVRRPTQAAPPPAITTTGAASTPARHPARAR